MGVHSPRHVVGFYQGGVLNPWCKPHLGRNTSFPPYEIERLIRISPTNNGPPFKTICVTSAFKRPLLGGKCVDKNFRTLCQKRGH